MVRMCSATTSCVLGPFANNAPPYVAYDLTAAAADEPIARAHFAIREACVGGRIVVTTDGAAELDLAAFADARYVAHPDALRRQLAVLARADERIDWDARWRQPGTRAPLQDDGAIAMLRQGGAVVKRTAWIDGARHDLVPTALVGEGGEAEIYDLGDGRVVKWWKPAGSIPTTPVRYGRDRGGDAPARRGAGQVARVARRVAGGGRRAERVRARGQAFDRRRRLRDVARRRRVAVQGRRAALAPRSRRSIWPMPSRCIVALHDAVAALHRAGVVIGDCNDLNVLVDGRAVHLIDLDSYQLAGFPCAMFSERFVDPAPARTHGPARSCRRARTTSTARLVSRSAAMALRTLLGVGPWGGVHAPAVVADRCPPSLRALRRLSVLGADITYPRAAHAIATLPDELVEEFRAISWRARSARRISARVARRPAAARVRVVRPGPRAPAVPDVPDRRAAPRRDRDRQLALPRDHGRRCRDRRARDHERTRRRAVARRRRVVARWSPRPRSHRQRARRSDARMGRYAARRRLLPCRRLRGGLRVSSGSRTARRSRRAAAARRPARRRSRDARRRPRVSVADHRRGRPVAHDRDRDRRRRGAHARGRPRHRRAMARRRRRCVRDRRASVHPGPTTASCAGRASSRLPSSCTRARSPRPPRSSPPAIASRHLPPASTCNARATPSASNSRNAQRNRGNRQGLTTPRRNARHHPAPHSRRTSIRRHARPTGRIGRTPPRSRPPPRRRGVRSTRSSRPPPTSRAFTCC